MIDQILQTINSNQLLGGGLVLMLVGWAGFQVRQLPLVLLRLADHLSARQLKIRDNSDLYDTALQFVTEGALGGKGPRDLELKYIQKPGGDPHNRADSMDGAHQLVATVTRFWAKLDGKYCRVSVTRGDEEGESPQSSPSSFLKPWTISIRVYGGGRPALERIALCILERQNQQKEHGVRVVVRTRFNGSEATRKPLRSFDTICLADSKKSKLVKTVRRFKDSEDLYRRRAQPWRLGMLFTGEPGTGKTSIVHALASEFGMDVFIMDITGFENDADLLRAFHSTTDRSIILFEDIDCVFSERERTSSGQDGGVTFSGLLNAIDGIGSPSNGRVVVMTTNHPEKLDPALIRAGRVDLQMEIGRPTREDALSYADRVYGPEAVKAVEMAYQVVDVVPTGAELEMLMREAASDQ